MKFYLVIVGHCNNPGYIDIHLSTPDKVEAVKAEVELEKRMNEVSPDSDEGMYWGHNASYVAIREIVM